LWCVKGRLPVEQDPAQSRNLSTLSIRAGELEQNSEPDLLVAASQEVCEISLFVQKGVQISMLLARSSNGIDSETEKLKKRHPRSSPG